LLDTTINVVILYGNFNLQEVAMCLYTDEGCYGVGNTMHNCRLCLAVPRFTCKLCENL